MKNMDKEKIPMKNKDIEKLIKAAKKKNQKVEMAHAVQILPKCSNVII